MNKKRTKVAVGAALLLASLLATGMLSTALGVSASSSGRQVNLPAPQVRNFTLYVRPNVLKMPDGKNINVFGYSKDPKGLATIPGPTLIVNQGDTVNVTLVNDRDPTKTKYNSTGAGHTIHLHGLDLPSQYDGDPMTAPGGLPVLQGHRYTYHFVARYSGTYWYHCHMSAAEHIQMGMYGALTIRPRGEPNRAYPNTPAFDKEYTLVLSDMDSVAHQVDWANLYSGGPTFNWTNYHANYFLINGKAFPETLMDPNTNIVGTVGQTVLVRLINAGYIVHAMHSHGFHFLVIGADGRRLDSPYYKDTLEVAPGERYEILFVFDKPGRYMFHDHFEQNTTNNGYYPGGMITMINVNNPDGSNPVPMSQVMTGM